MTFVPVLTRKTVLLPSSWRIWWESSFIRSTAINVFPEPVFKQTIVLCSRAASRSSTWRNKMKTGQADVWERYKMEQKLISYIIYVSSKLYSHQCISKYGQTCLIFSWCVYVVVDSFLLPRQAEERPHGRGGRGHQLQSCHAETIIQCLFHFVLLFESSLHKDKKKSQSIHLHSLK